MRESPSSPPPIRNSRFFRRLIPLLAVLCALLFAAGVRAQSNPIDLQITIFSSPDGKDRLAASYDQDVSDARIRQDIAQVATALGAAPPKVRITRVEGIPSGEAEFTGLADWSNGTVKLDPLIQSFKRYGKFQVVFFFDGNFPLKQAESFAQGPLRVEVKPNGNMVAYQIYIDQSRGVPANVPSVAETQGPGWKLIAGLAAIAAVVAATVFLIINVLLGQRRRREAGSLQLERNPGLPASRGASEGK